MAMSIGGANRIKAEMNVTPMIDVLLVLLVIFMLVSPLKPTGLPTLVPQAGGDRPPGQSTDLVLTVRSDGTLDLNQEAVERANLPARLAQIFKFRGDRVIFVRGEGNLEFGPVAQVMDIARGAGMTRVALMTTPIH
ncbi:MAG: biopolymer transporter ExbD [Bryobacteraceae bacterium]|jgi:biopolymer transport protein ExbD